MSDCIHAWVIWPETDGLEQKCLKCDAYRSTPSGTQNSIQQTPGIIPAATHLRFCQRQLDADGIEVGVSRQALAEVLAAYASAEESNAQLQEQYDLGYPAQQTQETVAMFQLFREAIAWGMVYGPEIPKHQWDEMRDSMCGQFVARTTPPNQQAAHTDIKTGREYTRCGCRIDAETDELLTGCCLHDELRQAAIDAALVAVRDILVDELDVGYMQAERIVKSRIGSNPLADANAKIEELENRLELAHAAPIKRGL